MAANENPEREKKGGKAAAAAAAKSLQSCPTLCHPTDGSPPGSPSPGILQARTLEWVAISFSSAWKGKVKVKLLSRVRLLATPWTAAYQAPPSMGISRQGCWSGVPLPSPYLVSFAHYFFTEFYTAECFTMTLTDLVKCHWVSGSCKVMLFHYLSLVQPPSPPLQLVHSIDSHQYMLYFSIFYTSVFWN